MSASCELFLLFVTSLDRLHIGMKAIIRDPYLGMGADSLDSKL